MKAQKQWLLVRGARFSLLLSAVFVCSGYRSATQAADGDEVEYTFGRPVKDDEKTYDWYRKTHADWAAKRYGVDPDKVGDGMDTWHWWCGGDNRDFGARWPSLRERTRTSSLRRSICWECYMPFRVSSDGKRLDSSTTPTVWPPINRTNTGSGLTG